MTSKHIVIDTVSLVSSFATNAELGAMLPSGSGDVVGPAGATGGNVVLFDGATGKLVKDGGALGTAAFTASGAYDASGAAAAAQAASLPLHSKADTAGAADTAAALATGADRTKLDGIAAGAEVNVNADWNAVAGDALIQNKPTISGSNTGDQTTIVGITGTIAQFNTACTDADFTTGGGTATGANTGDNSANSSVQFVGTTSIANNRASATQALTGITSIDGSAATLTTSRNIGGRAFNGSADIVAPTHKTGITTRDITTASGAVNVAHGLGRVPAFVRVTAQIVSAAVTQFANGSYDGTNHAGMCAVCPEGAATSITDTIFTSTAFELGFSVMPTIVNPYTGINRQTCTITVDATNIIFTWTKTGTVAAAVANILWECT